MAERMLQGDEEEKGDRDAADDTDLADSNLTPPTDTERAAFEETVEILIDLFLDEVPSVL